MHFHKPKSFFLHFIAVVIFGCGNYAFGQTIILPINTHNGQIIETCDAIFTHSGIDTIIPYEPNENYNITFVTDSVTAGRYYIKLDFLFFDLRAGDFFYIYDGPDDNARLIIQATGDQLAGRQVYSTGPSLHIRFTSTESDHGFGWRAKVQCFSQCEALRVNVGTDTGSFDFCPDINSIRFSALTHYLGGSSTASDFTYMWNFDETIVFGQEVMHTFPDPGAYPISVTVTDQINGCQVKVDNIVRIATIPDFNGTFPSFDTVCAREQFILTGVVNPATWRGFRSGIDTVAFINEMQSFESTLNFNIFGLTDQITEPEDLLKVCIKIEHVDFGQLRFELECPGGATVILHQPGEGGANLGEPVVGMPEFAGVGYEYCFSPKAHLQTMAQTSFSYHSYLDRAGIGYYFNVPFLPGGNYSPVQPFSGFAGCQLNGNWTLRISDNVPGLSGHVFGWSLSFDQRFYPDSLIFTPKIVGRQWLDGSTLLTGNPASMAKETDGNYHFVFRATDDFGCTWDTTIRVTVLPLPQAEITSQLEIPVCEGDSTILTVRPVRGSNLNWIYQWMMENAELAGRTYDTLMAKLPANYRVWVKDTLSGCFDLIDIMLSDKNCDLTIPNVFTPNGDGINDYFEIQNLEHYPRSQIVIYNRHGRKVFEHSDYFGNWWNGGNLPDGTYYFVLTYTRQARTRHAQGVITIIR